MKVLSCAKRFVNSNINKLNIVHRSYSIATVNSCDQFIIPMKETGVYFLYEAGCDPIKSTPIYIGETSTCIIQRMRNHKKSLNLPEWKGELTGKKFLKAKICLDANMDVYYISAKSLGITNKKESLFAESAFMAVLNPLAL